MAELVVQGDCLKLLADAETWPDNMFDALVTDPPSGTAFMDLDWDCFRRRHNPADVGRDNVFGRTSEHAPHSYGESERENFIAWLTEIMRHVYRVLKPGAHGLVWALPRTSHWTGIALENAGFEVRDCVHHFFGSGFPKNLNVSKAIDKAAGAEREVIAPNPNHRPVSGTSYEGIYAGGNTGAADLTSPATEEAKHWDGWGTAMKPALECWWLIRKPISEKSITANVLKWGTGAINIDGCRVRRAADDVPGWHKTGSYGRTDGFLGTDTFKIRDMPPEEVQARCGKKGRWPAHVILSHDPRCVLVGEERVKGCPATVTQGGEKNPFYNQDDKEFEKRHTEVEGYGDADGLETVDLWACVPGCPVRMLDDQGGRSRSREGKPRRSAKPGDGYGMVHTGAEYSDAGGVSRYFYTPKPSKSEREHGLDDMPETTLHRMRPDKDGATGLNTEPRWGPVQRKNGHPTLKSVALMEYLCRLITPPGGLILDPFCGSGTTGMAARREGFEFVGIEQDENHCEVARRRIEAALTLK